MTVSGFALIASSVSGSREAPGESETKDGTADGSAALVCHGCGRVHSSARLVMLPDGRQVGNHSEAYRAWTEAKWAMTLPDRVDKRRKGPHISKREYLEKVRQIRGDAAADALRAAMVELWKKR